jgi:hypothetical protein
MASHQVEIDEVNLGSVGFDKIGINRIQPYVTKVGSLEVMGSRMNFHLDAIVIRGIKIDLKLLLFEDFKITLDYILGTEVVEGQAVSLGELMFYFDIGDITLPFPDTEIAFDDLKVHDMALNVDPIRNLVLPAMEARNIKMDNVNLPLAGIILRGMGVGEADVRGVKVPDARAERIRFGNVHGASVTVPAISIPGITLGIAARDVEAEKTSVKLNEEKSTPWINIATTPLLTLAARLLVRTEAALTIDKIILKGLESEINMGALQLKDLTLPFNLLGIEMENILISNVQVPALKYREGD